MGFKAEEDGFAYLSDKEFSSQPQFHADLCDVPRHPVKCIQSPAYCSHFYFSLLYVYFAVL